MGSEAPSVNQILAGVLMQAFGRANKVLLKSISSEMIIQKCQLFEQNQCPVDM